MLAIVDEIEREGFKVLDQTVYLKPFMPKVGVFSKAQPTEEQWADICFGFELAKQMGALDIGQTVVVKHKAAMAIEAIEGTDKCILRGGELGRGEAVVVKTEKPNQDVRFDVPAVGIKTLMSMIDSGCKVLAVEAEKTIFVQQQDVLDMADRHGIVICAVDQEFVNSRKDALMKVMFSAGEASGDTHAASVANALREIDPSVEMFGMGGTLMERAGVRIVYDIKNLGVIGIVEIVKSLPKFF